jgi:hypothetical protein
VQSAHQQRVAEQAQARNLSNRAQPAADRRAAQAARAQEQTRAQQLAAQVRDPREKLMHYNYTITTL